jgi:TrmH family RNA methyltransferase
MRHRSAPSAVPAGERIATPRTAPAASLAVIPHGFRHPRVQRLRKLVERRRARHESRCFVVEGARVLGEALAAGATIEEVFVAGGTRDAAVEAARDRGVPVRVLERGVIERIADTVSPQPVLGVVGFVDVTLDAVMAATLVIVCVDIRDPGNLGTVLRSAEAAGAGGVICCDGSVDLYNPKVVRATAGSLFHVPVVVGGEPVEVLERLGTAGVSRLGTTAHAGEELDDVDLRAPVAFVLGNEAHGLPDRVHARVDRQVRIPMVGRTESLNVGMAASVLCFEAARQRRTP